MHEQQGTTASKYIRTCVHCGSEYERTSGHKLISQCQKCYHTAWRENNRDKVNRSSKTFKDKQNAAWHMWTNARKRALERGIPFAITKEDIIVPEFCPYLGLKLERAVGKGAPQPNSPSLDRIVPELGYVPGNIRVISNQANTMKGAATREELHAFANAIARFHP